MPTIGYTAIGASSAVTVDNWSTEVYTAAGARYTAASGDVIGSVSVYQKNTTAGQTTVGIYTYSGGVPVTRIATVNVPMTNTVGWKTVTGLSIALTAGVDYVVGLQYCGGTNGVGWAIAYESTGSTSSGSQCAAFPATWTQSSTGSGSVSAYATVTASSNDRTGSGTPTEGHDTSAGVGDWTGTGAAGSGAVTEGHDTSVGVGDWTGVTVYTDDFNRADTTAGGVGMGPNWNQTANSWYISGNRATKLAGDHYIRWVAPMPSVDHFIETDFDKADFDQYLWMHLRPAHNPPGSGGPPSESYEGGLNDTSGPTTNGANCEIGLVHSGGYTVLGRAPTSFGAGATGKVRLEAVGDKIRLYTDGTMVLEVTDATLSGMYVGYNLFVGADAAAFYDNFRAGEVVPPTFTASGTPTEAHDTSVGVGDWTGTGIAGSGNVTEPHDTSAGVGTASPPASSGGIIGWNTIDPSTGSTGDNWDETCFVADSLTYVALAGDTVTQFAIYGDGNGTTDMAIYEIVGGVPTNRVGSKVSVAVGTSPAWYTATASIPLTAGLRYGAAVDWYVDQSWNMRWNPIGPGGIILSDGNWSGELPATWTQTGTETATNSFYAVVTAVSPNRTGSGSVTERHDTSAGVGDNIPPSSGGIIGWDTIDPTVGVTAANYDDSCFVADSLTYVAVAGDTVTQFAIYGDGDGTADMAIYEVAGGIPTNRVGSKVTVTIGTAPAWYTAAASIALTPGVRYGVAVDFYPAGGQSWNMRWNSTGPGGTIISNGPDSGSLPAVWTQSSADTATNSFYAVVSAVSSDRTGSANVTEQHDTSAGVGAIGSTTPTGPAYPAAISVRKILDQYGRVYLARTFSSWSMASHLTNAEITTALEGVADNHFNGVTVWMGGAEDRGGTGWAGNKYKNAAGQSFWAGTPWASALGPAWASVDWLMTEALRLGITVHFSFCYGNGAVGAGADWAATSDTNMLNTGVALATRYAAYPNLVWHVMFDDTPGPGSGVGQKINKLFEGINATESPARPVRWTEVSNGTSTNGQGWYNPTGAGGSTNGNQTKFSINCLYSYNEDMAQQVEAVYAEVSGPVGNCEPGYIGSANYSGNERQQVRESNYAQFIEGGCLINYGDEAWWPFGAQPLLGSRTDWYNVPTDVPTIEARYCWDFIDTFLRDASYAPASTFVTTGEGTGDTKAAQGASPDAAAAYFPDARTVVVNTTILAGTDNIQVRWYDPVTGSYAFDAAAGSNSEGRSSSRSVTFPAAHPDGSRDYVLIVSRLSTVPTPAGAFLGTTPLTGLNIGTTPVVKLYIGTNQAWPVP